MTEDKVIQFLIESAKQSDSVQKLILFGSRARGDQTERSDYDIAIQFKKDSHDSSRIKFISKISEKSPTLCKIDIIDLDRELNQKFRNRIISEGKTLFETPSP